MQTRMIAMARNAAAFCGRLLDVRLPIGVLYDIPCARIDASHRRRGN